MPRGPCYAPSPPCIGGCIRVALGSREQTRYRVSISAESALDLALLIYSMDVRLILLGGQEGGQESSFNTPQRASFDFNRNMVQLYGKIQKRYVVPPLATTISLQQVLSQSWTGISSSTCLEGAAGLEGYATGTKASLSIAPRRNSL